MPFPTEVLVGLHGAGLPFCSTRPGSAFGLLSRFLETNWPFTP